jgi:cysteine desulfurase family protein (TIGR01976 family)
MACAQSWRDTGARHFQARRNGGNPTQYSQYQLRIARGGGVSMGDALGTATEFRGQSNLGSIADVDTIRSAFPALTRKHNGHAAAYLDGPGGTQIPRVVGEAMLQYLYHHNANARWAFPTSRETDGAILDARQTMAEWVGGNAEEIVFSANMTSATFHLSRALARSWHHGDSIVVTAQDHHANIDTWRAAATDHGLELRIAGILADGSLDMDDLRRKITGGTRLVAFSAGSNVLGTINDVKQLVEMVHASGALAFVDAVHYAGHLPPDVRRWNCDFMACSAYKFYGPHVGVLWGRKTLITEIDAPRLAPACASGRSRLETGTLNHEGIVGAATAVNFLASLDTTNTSRRERLLRVCNALHTRGRALFQRLWDGFNAIDAVTCFGPSPGCERTSTLSFSIAGIDAPRAAAALAESGLFLSHGNFYAETLVGILTAEKNGLLRIGCAAYTTEEEITRLLKAVAELTAASKRRVAPLKHS